MNGYQKVPPTFDTPEQAVGLETGTGRAVLRNTRALITIGIAIFVVTAIAFVTTAFWLSSIQSDQQTEKSVLLVCNYLPPSETVRPVVDVPAFSAGTEADDYIVDFNYLYLDANSRWSFITDQFSIHNTGLYRFSANLIVDFKGDETGEVVAGIYAMTDLGKAFNDTSASGGSGEAPISLITQLATTRNPNVQLAFQGQINKNTRVFVAAFQVKGKGAVFRDYYDCGSIAFSALSVR